ncbi:MAG: VCBS repeat-containing protein, partial [Planctomycetota bacterium]
MESHPSAKVLLVLIGLIGLFLQSQPDEYDTDVRRVLNQRERLDETVWAREVESHRYESVIVTFWDQLRTSSQPLAGFNDIAFSTIRLPERWREQPLENGIIQHVAIGSQSMSRDEWIEQVVLAITRGDRLVQSEWHHEAFERTEGVDGQAHSRVRLELHLENAVRSVRTILRGELQIEWMDANDGTPLPRVKNIDATKLVRLTRSTDDGFRCVATIPASNRWENYFLATRDFDHDGLPEVVFDDQIISVRQNQFTSRWLVDCQPLRTDTTLPVTSGLIHDLNGDGLDDLVVASRELRPRIYFGTGQMTFSAEPVRIQAVPPLSGTSTCIAAGDVDLDGDVDLWLTQYKPPYQDGSMPTPYYDANDGYASYLLLNDGHGEFRDATIPSGLDAKRRRRTYSSSFWDCDRDGDCDLLVVSDFAGVDLYLNDGRGNFRDATADLFDETSLFGMSHRIDDFDGDGRLDLFSVGMSSTTARRLSLLNLERNDHPAGLFDRLRMGHGNRLYLARGTTSDQDFFQPSWADSVARTGWSWGVASFDFD